MTSTAAETTRRRGPLVSRGGPATESDVACSNPCLFRLVRARTLLRRVSQSLAHWQSNPHCGCLPAFTPSGRFTHPLDVLLNRWRDTASNQLPNDFSIHFHERFRLCPVCLCILPMFGRWRSINQHMEVTGWGWTHNLGTHRMPHHIPHHPHWCDQHLN